MVGLKPSSSCVVCFYRSFRISNFYFVYLSQILLLCCCSSEIAFAGVVVYSLLQYSGGIFGVGLPVGFVGFCKGVCGVVGFVEVLRLDGSGALEC